jgi:hypothetical protein
MNTFITSASYNNLYWTVTDPNRKGSSITLQPFNGSPAQQFHVFPNNIIAGCSGFSVDVAGGLRQGGNLIQWDFHGGNNQQFRFNPDGTITVGELAISVDQNYGLIADAHRAEPQQLWRICTRVPQ